MKLLFTDLETAPNLAWVWGLWKQDVPLSMLVESGYMLCWSAKWYRQDEVFFSSLQDGRNAMVGKAWDLLNEADVVCTYNGNSFDLPILNQEFLREELPPPSPYKRIDLMKVVKKQFRLPSNKLQYVSDNLLGLGGKENAGGFETWLGVMNNDTDAWTRMRTYNERDVVALEEIYDRLLPWIPGHPNVNLYLDQKDTCPNCGSVDLRKEGFAYTLQGKFQQYQCKWCGRWSRGTKRLEGVEIVGVN